MFDDPKFIAAMVLFVTNAAALVKVATDLIRMKADRADTKALRDADSQKLHDDVLKHTMQLSQIRDTLTLHNTVMSDMQQAMSELNVNCAKLSVVVEQLTETVKELKK